jgi:hypothetical protein
MVTRDLVTNLLARGLLTLKRILGRALMMKDNLQTSGWTFEAIESAVPFVLSPMCSEVDFSESG